MPWYLVENKIYYYTVSVVLIISLAVDKLTNTDVTYSDTCKCMIYLCLRYEELDTHLKVLSRMHISCQHVSVNDRDIVARNGHECMFTNLITITAAQPRHDTKFQYAVTFHCVTFIRLYCKT